jgi:ABC-2 type transport system permease protein
VAELAFIYRRLIGARVRAQLQYRASFTMDFVGSILTGFLDFVTLLVLFTHLIRMGGFSVGEVAFLYAVSQIAFSIDDMLIGQLDDLPQMIRTGTLDTFLVRPLGSLFQVISSDLAIRRLGRITEGFIVLGYALTKVHIHWDIGRIVMMPVMIVSAAAIFAGVWIAVVCISFWFVDSREFANAFTYGGSFMTQYPLTIFGAWLRRLLAFVIPMAFIVYFPSLYILNKPDPLGMPHALRYISPFVAVASLVVGCGVWRFAVRHYRSTGS